MNTKAGVLLLVLMTMLMQFAMAQKKEEFPKTGLSWIAQTDEELYETFSAISPEDAFQHVLKAAIHFDKVGKEQAIRDFRAYPSKWYRHRQGLLIGSFDCVDGGMFQAWPVPNYAWLYEKKGLIVKLRDRKNQNYGQILCSDAADAWKSGKRVVFLSYYHTFLATPPIINQAIIGIQPKTGNGLVLFTQYPSKTIRTEELEQLFVSGKLGRLE